MSLSVVELKGAGEMYQTSRVLSREVWERTVEAIAVSASRSSNVTNAVEYVYQYTLFGEQLYRLQAAGESLVASLDVVSWRFS